MKPTLPTPLAEPSEQRSAFTLTELLVIVAIVAILFSLMLPALAGAGGRSRVAQCGGNLKEYTVVLELYAMDNHNKLPQDNAANDNWPWDLTATNFNNLTKYGATRDMLYCPANPGQNNDTLWFYGGGSIHVTDYALTFPGIPGLLFTNVNSSLIPSAITFGPLLMPPAPSSKRVLVADSTISQHGQTDATKVASYQWTGLHGGAVLPNGVLFSHRTSHLNGALPAGGNLGMLDGHVEWRKFNDMISRMAPPEGSPTTELTWWW